MVLNLYSWTALMVLSGLGSEETVVRKGAQRNVQPLKKPSEILTFIVETWVLVPNIQLF